MALGFRRRGRAGAYLYEADLDAGERETIAELMESVADLLDPDGGGHLVHDDPLARALADLAPSPEPDRDDPALERLVPRGADDDADEEEFRRLTAGGLRRRKADGLRSSAATLERPGPLSLTPGDAVTFLSALTDVRLLLGERIGLRNDDDDRALAAVLEVANDEDPIHLFVALYDGLTWMQESLTQQVLRSL